MRKLVLRSIQTCAAVCATLACMVALTYFLFMLPGGLSDLFTFVGLIMAGISSTILTFDKMKQAMLRDEQKTGSGDYQFFFERNRNRDKYKQTKYGFATKA